eukprot:gnl/MRDRNA2_/MRDRNA2_325123_c0_seq1.p1 gnl/MRDRNA2_/MRDRNA2_325123_c0~~gnl/MRDRNA2_/MRDRNA2_325123_c0_seq1.p1  ORF type:complete len:390 (-),score=45.24 gnl/MRDRNA2_/MRDRNA2_325123_c0_seq1:40-1089(-)
MCQGEIAKRLCSCFGSVTTGSMTVAGLATWLVPLVVTFIFGEDCQGAWKATWDLCDDYTGRHGPFDLCGDESSDWVKGTGFCKSCLLTTQDICDARWQAQDRCTMQIITTLSSLAVSKALVAACIPLALILAMCCASNVPDDAVPDDVVPDDVVPEAPDDGRYWCGCCRACTCSCCSTLRCYIRLRCRTDPADVVIKLKCFCIKGEASIVTPFCTALSMHSQLIVWTDICLVWGLFQPLVILACVFAIQAQLFAQRVACHKFGVQFNCDDTIQVQYGFLYFGMIFSLILCCLHGASAPGVPWKLAVVPALSVALAFFGLLIFRVVARPRRVVAAESNDTNSSPERLLPN